MSLDLTCIYMYTMNDWWARQVKCMSAVIAKAASRNVAFKAARMRYCIQLWRVKTSLLCVIQMMQM